MTNPRCHNQSSLRHPCHEVSANGHRSKCRLDEAVIGAYNHTSSFLFHSIWVFSGLQ
jgi:hypothetical protein